MTKEWRPIPGYEGIYEVSNYGDIRSLDRVVAHPRYPQGIRRSGCVMKQRLVKGYPMVCLRKDSKSEHMTVHKAVLLAFPRGEGDQARHLDGNRTNNRSDNLMWGTAQQNADDRRNHGTWTHGDNHAKSIIDAGTVRLIRSLREMGYTFSSIAHLVNWSRMRVHEVWKGRTWAHVD